VHLPPPYGDWSCDLICGGFPCQDISTAGRGVGIHGERSGLWFEFARIIRELRPRYVLVENVAALRVRGMDAVLGELAALGYDAEWECLPAAAFGAVHLRDRVFIVAYPECFRYGERVCDWRAGELGIIDGCPALSEWGAGLHLDSGNEIKSRAAAGYGGWKVEPDVGRVADGIPNRVERLRGLGNAIVPAIAEWIGKQIMKIEDPR